ncbi:MAG: PQQ-binding-like beta-propeller repeat protein [Planctomycetes bacterium]|nr:PQQ-binding-like beta-propeller repeat protein [Planctomycetota bacterium]
MRRQGIDHHGQCIRKGAGSLSLCLSLLLLLVIAGLTAYVLFEKDWAKSEIDDTRLNELSNTALPEAGSSTGDWPQWRGPKRDGVSSEKGLLAAWPADGPKELWRQPAGKGYSTLAVSRGRVFTVFQDGDSEAVCSWDAETGKELWRFRYPARYVNGYGNGPRSTPTIAGDLLYAVGGTGMMHCLKAFTDNPAGEKVWRRDLLSDFGAKNLQWGVSFSPLVEGDLVYTNPGGPNGHSLAALDKKTGATEWTSQDDPAGYSSPLSATTAGERQVVFFTGSGLVAVTPDAGKLLWRYPWETAFGANIATPIVVEDYVFISSGYNRGCTVVKVEKSDSGFEARRVYENKRMRTHFSTCVRYQDCLFGFDDTTLICMEFRTGKVLWDQRDFGKGSLLVADGNLVILGETGLVALAEATPAGYREISRFTFSEGRCWSVPVVANGRMYIRDEEKVVCYDVRRQ